MAAGHLKRGEQGERIAAELLAGKKYKILERNWRAGRLEIDLICNHGKTLVFVEVKTRGPGSLGAPGQAVDAKKQANLVRAAGQYLSQNDLWETPCRFDVVLVGPDGAAEHIEDAFQAGVDWQPW